MGEPVIYISYLLRLWQVSSDEDPSLRIQLENTRTSEKCSFGDFDALVAYLCQVLGSEQDSLKEENISYG
jgi:hypothetical protein